MRGCVRSKERKDFTVVFLLENRAESNRVVRIRGQIT